MVAALATLAASCGPAERSDVQSSGAPVGTPLGARQQAAGFTAFAPHVIVDRQGWGEPLEAVRLMVPAGWRVSSDVAWYGPDQCGVGLAQPVVTMVSPDGRSVIEMGHALKLDSWQTQVNWQAVPEHQRLVMQNAQQEEQARQAQLAQQLSSQGGRCGVGTANSAAEIAQRLLVPLRGADVRVNGTRPAPDLAASMAQTAAQLQQMPATPGLSSQSYGDAATVEMERAGVVERTTFGVLGMRSVIDGLDLAGSGVPSSRTVIDGVSTTALFTVRAPRDRIDQVEGVASTVFATMQNSPVWTAAMQRLNASLSQIRHQGNMATLNAMAHRGQAAAAARAETADAQMAAWRAGDQASEHRTAAFIDLIYESSGWVDPQTGQRHRVPNGQQAFSNGQGGVAVGPAGSSPGGGWTAMQPAPIG